MIISDKNAYKIVKSLMPEEAVLYSETLFPDWIKMGAITIDNENTTEIVHLSEMTQYPRYVVITLKDQSTVYMPIIHHTFFHPKQYDDVISCTVIPIPKADIDRIGDIQHLKLTIIIVLIIIAMIAYPRWRKYREHKQLQTLAYQTQHARIEKQNTINKSLKDLKNRLYTVSQTLQKPLYVLTNAPGPIQAQLSVQHLGFGINKFNDAAAHSFYRDNPAQDFLDHENKYSYGIYLFVPNFPILPLQFDYFSNKQKKSTKYNKKNPVISINTIRKLTDKETEQLFSEVKRLDYSSREEAEAYLPELKYRYFRKHYVITEEDMKHPELAYHYYTLKTKIFNKKNTNYYISSSNPNLSLKEQKMLINQFVKNFDINQEAFNHCCSWQPVQLTNTP